LLPFLATLASVIVVLPGSIFQIFGVYSNCVCQTEVATWLLPASQKWTLLYFNLPEDAELRLEHITTGMAWACTAVAGGLVVVGYWYQRVLKASIGSIIVGLEEI